MKRTRWIANSSKTRLGSSYEANNNGPLEGDKRMPQPKYEINGTDVSDIKNRNEKRVLTLVPVILSEYYEDFIFDPLDIQDIYALSLNLLPARYTQKGSIILSDRLSDFEIKSKIRDAVERVLDNPTRAQK